MLANVLLFNHGATQPQEAPTPLGVGGKDTFWQPPYCLDPFVSTTHVFMCSTIYFFNKT